MSSPTYPPDGAVEHLRQSFFSAGEMDNVEQVDWLFATTFLQADNATQALDHASTFPAVMRCLLMHGADAQSIRLHRGDSLC